MKLTKTVLALAFLGLSACSSNDGRSNDPAPTTKPAEAPKAEPAPQPAPRRADPRHSQPQIPDSTPSYSSPPHPSLRKLVCNHEIIEAGQKLSDAFWSSTGSQALDTWQDTVKACEQFQKQIDQDPCNFYVFDQSTGAPLTLDETYSKCTSAYQAVQNLSALPTFESFSDSRDITKMPKHFSLVIRSASVYKKLGANDLYLQNGKVVPTDKVDFEQNHCQLVGLSENSAFTPRSLEFLVTFADALGFKAVAQNTDGIVLDCGNRSAAGFHSTVSELQSTFGNGLELVFLKD